ncbi:DUF3862 domain-containing protein [Desmospora profundinema]|uniref:DUF3862 domain-containing protein n=1 Tax=Desmospora profundinema TaxID=1571184 RepID=A0ABU1IK38_9BACL|nr:DUF3862 domain-containing protein [Desmospora profundinema]MDR6225131.1 hypothetical protein [Desmospora profundinema]
MTTVTDDAPHHLMKKIILIVGGIFLGFALLGVACVAVLGVAFEEADKELEKIESEINTPEEGTADERSEEDSSDTTLTMDKYNQIENGMSYDEVVEIIGFEGEENSQNEVAGVKTVMYTWQNSDGSNMNAIFQDDKLNSKSQFGLK